MRRSRGHLIEDGEEQPCSKPGERLLDDIAGFVRSNLTRQIGPDETSDVVEEALAGLGARLLLTVLDQMAAGTAHEESQDDSQATYAPRLTKEEGLIDWSQSAAQIHN